MATMPLWSLYNATTEVRIDALTLRQVHGILLAVRKLNLETWLAWQEGTTQWRSGQEVITWLGEQIVDNDPEKTALPVFRGEGGGDLLFHESEDVAENEQSSEGNIGRERRSSPRYEIKWKIFIAHAGRTVGNETLDISVGGIRLRDPIPDDWPDNVDVIIFRDGQELTIRCHTIKSEHEASRRRLFIEQCNRMDMLRVWILQSAGEST